VGLAGGAAVAGVEVVFRACAVPGRRQATKGGARGAATAVQGVDAGPRDWPAAWAEGTTTKTSRCPTAVLLRAPAEEGVASGTGNVYHEVRTIISLQV
jgi:hypothetical protein